MTVRPNPQIRHGVRATVVVATTLALSGSTAPIAAGEQPQGRSDHEQAKHASGNPAGPAAYRSVDEPLPLERARMPLAEEEPAPKKPSPKPTPRDPKAIARAIVGDAAQLGCFKNIVRRESGWDHLAQNPSSGAYGLVQALPGSKMASMGADWRTNPETQLKWGLKYMNERYGSPCDAWAWWQRHNWY